MNTDIRLSVDFWSHPKTIKLKRKLGLEGPVSLQILWSWAAKNRPEGDLSDMDDEDIEIAADWDGEEGKFVSTLVDLRWLDRTDTGYVLHEWAEHNWWAADASNRSDVARLSAMASKYPELHARYVAAGARGITKEEYERATKEYKEQRIANEAPANDSKLLNGRPANANESLSDRSAIANTVLAPSPSPSLKTKNTLTGAAAASPRSKDKIASTSESSEQEVYLPLSEAPNAFRQAAEYFCLKTGRKGLSEDDIAALRTLNSAHTPARVMREIDTAVERFQRKQRSLLLLDFEYIAKALEYQTSLPQKKVQVSASHKREPVPKFSPAASKEYTPEEEARLEAQCCGGGEKKCA